MKSKKLFFLFMLIFMSVINGNAQELTVTYLATFNVKSPDLFAKNGMPEEMRNMMVNAYKDIKLTYALSYSNGESEFCMLPSKEKQTITIMGQSIDLNTAMAQQRDNIIYRNINKNLSVKKVNFLGKVFLIKEDIKCDTFEIISNEKKEILGYECQKALSKDKKKTVWFTEYIPIQEGPVMTNLKGLVLEADTNEYIYIATNLENKVKKIITEPIDGQKITEKDFNEFVKKKSEMLKRGNSLSE